MAKKVRKKTKAELADPAFRKSATSQSDVLIRAMAECDKLSKSRHQYVLNVANDNWISSFDEIDDDAAFERESRRWAKLRREFVSTVSKALEIHTFTCNYNASRGIKPLTKLVKHASCDAGTALRLYWVNDPVYFTQYDTISECPDEEEQDVMRLQNAVKRRFKAMDFKTRQFFFDPTPWVTAGDVDLDLLNMPESMLSPIP